LPTDPACGSLAIIASDSLPASSDPNSPPSSRPETLNAAEPASATPFALIR